MIASLLMMSRSDEAAPLFEGKCSPDSGLVARAREYVHEQGLSLSPASSGGDEVVARARAYVLSRSLTPTCSPVHTPVGAAASSQVSHTSIGSYTKRATGPGAACAEGLESELFSTCRQSAATDNVVGKSALSVKSGTRWWALAGWRSMLGRLLVRGDDAR